MNSVPRDGSRFYLIDTLRGIAALAIVLFHAEEGDHIRGLIAVMPRWLAAIFEHGNLGVSIFFVISGFVIAHSLTGLALTPGTALRFVLRRSVRLDPPYWVAIVLSIGFAWLSARFVAGKASPTYSAETIVAHLFYLQDLLGLPAISTVFWTLCLEIQFYIVYMLILLIGGGDPVTRPQATTRYVLLGAALVSLLWPFDIAPQIWPGLFLPRWHGFLLGVFCYWAYRESAVRLYFALYAAAVLVASVITGSSFSLIAVLCSLFVLAAAIGGRLQATRRIAVLQGLGLVSYSLYLTHNPITGAAFRILYRITGESLAAQAADLVIVILACVAFAYVIWWLVEKPSMALARRINLRPRPV